MAIARFDAYRALIIEAAAKFNLTAVREPDAIERRLFLDALGLARLLTQRTLLPPACRVLDIGSGAGLPGMPVKIARPDLRLTLLDSHAKRCDFLRAVALELNLDALDVVEGRAEECARDPALRENFDLVLARAVAPLPVLIEYALPYLRVGGHLAATKGAAAGRELEESQRALDELGASTAEVVEVASQNDRASSAVLIMKSRPTPDRYPRRTGTPTKRPLA